MTIKSILAGVVMLATLVSVSGCKKEEPAASPTDTQKTTESVTAPAASAVIGAASEVKQAAETAVGGVTQAVVEAASPVAQAQTLIDRAKGYVADQKFQEALDTLKQLAGTQQTPVQQQLVDGLKAQIQAALAKATAADPASVLGGALGGKK